MLFPRPYKSYQVLFTFLLSKHYPKNIRIRLLPHFIYCHGDPVFVTVGIEQENDGLLCNSFLFSTFFIIKPVVLMMLFHCFVSKYHYFFCMLPYNKCLREESCIYTFIRLEKAAQNTHGCNVYQTNITCYNCTL